MKKSPIQRSLTASLTPRELLRVVRVFNQENAHASDLPKADYIAGLWVIAVRLYPEKLV